MNHPYSTRLLLCGLLVVGCGGDDPKPTPPPQPGQPAPNAPAPVPGQPVGSGSAMPSQLKLEDVVSCPPPTNQRKCDPNAVKPVATGPNQPPKPNDPNNLTCTPPDYCLPTNQGYFCGKCPDRDTIRHVFQDRDFVTENNRDPFDSGMVVKAGSGSGSGLAPDAAGKCNRSPNIAAGYGYQDLKLVGILRQGTVRKVLMMDPSNLGWIIRVGDCVGKERAWVSEISEEFICMQPTDGSRRSEPYCPVLHPKQVVTAPPDVTGDTPSVAPPVTPSPTVPSPTPGPTTPGGTRIVVPPPPTPQPQPQPPQQAPTNLRP